MRSAYSSATLECRLLNISCGYADPGVSGADGEGESSEDGEDVSGIDNTVCDGGESEYEDAVDIRVSFSTDAERLDDSEDDTTRFCPS